MSILPCLVLLAACEPKPPRTYPVFVDTSEEPTADTSDTSSDTGNPDDTSDTGSPAIPDPVEVGFRGQVVTVSGTPFGFDDTIALEEVTGSFTYDRAVADLRPADPDRGDYDHRALSGPFSLSVGGRTITGSGNPFVTIELFSDTFRYVDGPQLGDVGVDRTCSVDGITDPDIEMSLSFTPTNGVDAFPTDVLPAIFPFVDFDLLASVAVTFSVEDEDGELLFSLIEVTTE